MHKRAAEARHLAWEVQARFGGEGSLATATPAEERPVTAKELAEALDSKWAVAAVTDALSTRLDELRSELDMIELRDIRTAIIGLVILPSESSRVQSGFTSVLQAKACSHFAT
jgi:hypothetical protein